MFVKRFGESILEGDPFRKLGHGVSRRAVPLVVERESVATQPVVQVQRVPNERSRIVHGAPGHNPTNHVMEFRMAGLSGSKQRSAFLPLGHIHADPSVREPAPTAGLDAIDNVRPRGIRQLPRLDVQELPGSRPSPDLSSSSLILQGGRMRRSNSSRDDTCGNKRDYTSKQTKLHSGSADDCRQKGADLCSSTAHNRLMCCLTSPSRSRPASVRFPFSFFVLSSKTTVPVPYWLEHHQILSYGRANAIENNRMITSTDLKSFSVAHWHGKKICVCQES